MLSISICPSFIFLAMFSHLSTLYRRLFFSHWFAKPMRLLQITIQINWTRRKYSSRMHTVRSSPYAGSLSGGLPDRDPLDRYPPPSWTDTPLLDRHPLDRDNTPDGRWDQSARQEVTSYRDLLCEQNDIRK